ncbi:PKD domain-containing protein [Chloroflexota bacterium]
MSKTVIFRLLICVTLSVATAINLGTVLSLADGNSTPDMEWDQTFGSIYNEGACSVHQTMDGGYILAGFTEINGMDNWDVYLVKADSSGNMEWEKTFGGNGYDIARAVQQTNDGGYLIAGATESYGSGLSQVYLIKVDTSGNIEWEKTFSGMEAFSLQLTTDNGYIVTGSSSSCVYLLKTDDSGNMEWEKQIGGDGSQHGRSVYQTADGGYAVAGLEVNVDGIQDGYLVKTDASGNVEWEQTYNTDSKDDLFSVQQTTDGGYVMAGTTESYEMDIHDVYVIKTDVLGNMEWNQTFGGSGYDYGRFIYQTTDGGYTVAGTTDSYGAGLRDFYLVKSDATGNVEWEQTFGGVSYETDLSAQQTADGGCVMVGTTTSFGAGGYDAYLVKVAPEDSPNVPPVADAGDPYLAQLGYSVELNASASYDQDGTIVSYDWDFGDNTMGSGSLVSHTYTAVGIYEVNLAVTDDRGAQSSDTTMMVVYDPDTGSATGGGWFWSAPGNLKQDPESEGKATFGFVVKYKYEVADGNLEFQYHVGDINLKDTEITWLVVSVSNAQFQGEGTLNGEGLYTFRVLAKDGDKAGGQPDEFTIKIWQGTDTEADPIYKALNAQLGGGNIIVHNN